MTDADVQTTQTTVIHSLNEIPAFADEAEEFEFWATHELGDEVIDPMGPLPEDVLPRARTRPVSVRLNDDVLARLKALARLKGKGYQTLLKEFIAERLYEEEKRHGVIRRAGTGAATRAATPRSPASRRSARRRPPAG